MSVNDKLNEAGEALKATGLEHVSITLHRDGTFSVGVKSDPQIYGCDCFGYDPMPAVAYVQAMAKREPRARELAIKADAERIARELHDREERKAA